MALPARTTQIVSEIQIAGYGPVYVTQTVGEVLTAGFAPVRTSQVVAEVVNSGAGYARASQLVAEVLVPYFVVPPLVTYPSYPQLVGLGFSVIRRPLFSTGKGIAASGREVRVQYFSFPRWEWELTYEYLPDAPKNGSTASDYRTYVGFFLAVAGGTLPFLFKDPDDHTVTNNQIAVGDGTTTTFTLNRTYGLGSDVGTEPIGYLDTSAAFNAYENGVSTGAYTLNTTTPVNQQITFSTPPASGVSITVDMSYYFYVTFKDDQIDMEKFMYQLWSLKKVTLISQKG